MSETISVIIPVYRVEQYLDQCIASVTKQTYQQLEILLVDDGSPDQCGMMCDRWAKMDHRIKVIHKENGGLSEARNAGLDAANGAYISFVDSDDCIAPTMMEQLLAALKQESADIAECNYSIFRNELPAEDDANYKMTTGYDMAEAMSLLLDERTFKYPVWNKLYRKEIFHSLRFETGKLHEDVFLTYQAFGLCKRLVKIETSLYYYRQRSGSIMESKFSVRNLDSLEARKKQFFYLKKNLPELSGKAQSQLLGNCLYLGQKALRNPDSAVTEDVIKRIRILFDEAYEIQHIQGNKQQKIWFCIAKRNFMGCCLMRNRLRIGL